jgi:ferredoxin
LDKWLKLNADYASKWPNITIKREAPADANDFDGQPNKLENHFSAGPGQGD